MIITRLEDFILQSCDNSRNKGRLGVGKEWDGGDQCATVEVDHILIIMMMMRRRRRMMTNDDRQLRDTLYPLYKVTNLSRLQNRKNSPDNL